LQNNEATGSHKYPLTGSRTPNSPLQKTLP